MTAGDFTPHVGTAFAIEGMPSTLADVAERGPGSFSLYFRGPRTPVLEQRTYTLVHEHLGALEVFLGPVEADETGTLYEAVFSSST